MTNQYMTKLYHDLLSNSPQTVTIDIPADMGTGQISQVVTKQGAVVSDWKMNYFSDMNVQGVSCEDYIQLLFCFNDGVSWNIADARQCVSIQKGESCIYRGHGKMEYLCYSGKTNFLFKNIKIPMPYFHKILSDYFEDSEIDAYEKKLLTGISKVSITPYMEHIFAELKDFTQYRGGLGYLFLESKVFELLSVYLSEVLELSILSSSYISIALYHLNIMIKRDDDRVGIGAKGMTGEGYKGHSFWDTEMFLMPYYLLTDPAAAKTLLGYRWRSLPGAFKKASENGYQGAMFPWESAWLDDGEVTPLYCGADIVTGKSSPVLTGMIEQHISADIAWGVWLYYQATGDDDFMNRRGCELLIEIARFWASRVEWQDDTQRYEIKNVIGPDEYKDHVDNNAFTNYLTVFAMEQAERCIKDMPTQWPDAYAKLSDSYDLNALAAELQDKKAKVYLPQPNADGIVPQNAQYLGLDAIDLSKYKNQQGVSSIYEDYSPAQMNHLMVSKQADLVMLMRIMPDLFDAETRRKNFIFYESRTLHDSSLSHGQHCVLAAWEGLDDMALDMYRHAIAIDLGPNMKSSDLGIHSASMGNVWQCVVCGFAGLEWHEGGLSLRSHLPASWQRAAFNIVWRGAKLHVEVTHAGITVTHRGGSAVEITVDGHPVKLAAE